MMKNPPGDNSGDFLDGVAKTIKEHDLLRRGEVVLTACSGGVDSMVLLDVLVRLSKDLGVTVVAAQLDHRLRGQESKDDQRLVARVCRDGGIPFVGGSEDVSAFSREKGLSIQDAARRLRYRFLRRVLRRFEGDRIATAHHADDQVETVLMRLMRGTGPRGLRGIPISREGLFIRPFLKEWKSEIISYATANGVSFREDPGNRELHYQRNRIRNSLIPSLETYNPCIKGALYRMSAWVAEEGETFDSLMDETLRKVEFTTTGREITVNRDKLIECRPLVIKEIVRRSMMGLGVHYGPSSRHLAVALKFVRNAGSGRRLDLPEGVVIGRDFDEFFLARQARGGETEKGPFLEVEMSMGWRGEIQSSRGNCRVLVDISPASEVDEYKGTAFHQYFDLDDVVMPVRARRWREGDSLGVFGMQGRKKVSDILIDEKVPLRNRNDVLVLEDAKSILWVVGVRRGSRGQVAGGCGKIASISFEALPGGEGLNLARRTD